MMKFKQSHETELYLSEAGYLVIKQTDWTQEENTIYLSPDQALQVYKFIEDKKTDHLEIWSQPREGEA